MEANTKIKLCRLVGFFTKKEVGVLRTSAANRNWNL